MLRLYNTVLLPVRPIVSLRAWWSRRDPRARREWAERRARVLPQVATGGIWLHGSSVGEATLVASVAGRLRERRPDLPLAVSAFTRTGRRTLPEPPRVDAAFFVPLDFPGLPGRLLDALRPRCLVLIETELWPNLLHEAARRGVPVALVNGRLSPERMSRYRWLGALYRPALARLARVCAQSAEDAERFRALGVGESELSVAGNVKYDVAAPNVDPRALRARFGLDPSRPVVVAGSTAEGEDAPVFDAMARLRSGHPEAFLVLAPRHPERADDVSRLADARGSRLHRLSRGNDPAAGAADGLLVDTIGELAALYAIAAAAFVGGSLVPRGGHTVLAPAAAGTPVLFGPHTRHVAEPAEALLRAGGAYRVRDAEELAQRWIELVGDEDLRARVARAAAEVLAANRGALERNVTAILGLVDGQLP